MRHSAVAILLCFFFATTAPAQSGFNIGVSVHLENDPAMRPSQLSLVAQSGATSIRDDVSWAYIEMEKDHLAMPARFDDLVNQALQAQLKPLLILDYGNQLYDSGDNPASPEALNAFARSAAFVVQHFKGKVHMYEMW